MNKVVAALVFLAVTAAVAACAPQPPIASKDGGVRQSPKPTKPTENAVLPDLQWERHNRPSIKATVYYPKGWELRNIGPEDSREFGFYERPVAPGGHEASIWFSMVPQTDGYDRSIQSAAEDGWEVRSLTVKGNRAVVAIRPGIVEATGATYVKWVIKTADRSYMVSLEIASAQVSSDKLAYYKQMVRTMVEKMEIGQE